MKLIELIALKVDWYNTLKNQVKSDNQQHWLNVCDEHITILNNQLPSGSGLNVGCDIDLLVSNDKKIVILTSYQHMNNGQYTKWTDHKIIIKPSFYGCNLKITGPNKDDIKSYLADEFIDCFNSKPDRTKLNI